MQFLSGVLNYKIPEKNHCSIWLNAGEIDRSVCVWVCVCVCVAKTWEKGLKCADGSQ